MVFAYFDVHDVGVRDNNFWIPSVFNKFSLFITYGPADLFIKKNIITDNFPGKARKGVVNLRPPNLKLAGKFAIFVW